MTSHGNELGKRKWNMPTVQGGFGLAENPEAYVGPDVQNITSPIGTLLYRVASHRIYCRQPPSSESIPNDAIGEVSYQRGSAQIHYSNLVEDEQYQRIGEIVYLESDYVSGVELEPRTQDASGLARFGSGLNIVRND